MTSFPLQIVTPGGQAYDGMAQKLFCRTIVGDVAKVLPLMIEEIRQRKAE